MKKSLFLIAIFLLTISCANSEKFGDGREDMLSLDDYESPCELLSEAKIKEVLSIPAIAETDIYEKKDNFPICFYKWESITFPGEIGRTTKETLDFPAEASIVLVKNITKKGYQNSIKVYDDGQPVDRIGEEAMYSPIKRQLTFLSNGNLVHVRVRISADEAANKDKAIKLARLISEEI